MCCRFHLQEQSAGELDQNGTKLGVSPWLGLGATQERIQPIPRKENVTVRRPETVGWLSRGYVHVRRTRGEGLTACFAAAAAPMPLDRCGDALLRVRVAAAPASSFSFVACELCWFVGDDAAGACSSTKTRNRGERADTLLFFQGERFSPSPGALPCALSSVEPEQHVGGDR